ncbi:MAG TPA: DUF4124 domain-containing protein [Steroidobacteraceae bacterium]|jgi:uridine phosphorylase
MRTEVRLRLQNAAARAQLARRPTSAADIKLRATIVSAAGALALLTIMSGPAHAGDTQVYKTVDAQGNVVYTDKPMSSKVPKTSVRVHEPSAADLAQLAQEQQASHAAEIERLQQTLTHSASEAQQAQQQKEKQVRCDNARNRFYSLKDATRIYQRDAQGNRVYLPDEAADAKRAEARRAMDAACAP